MGKTLIIKTGYSETFSEARSSDICSLGDVVRTLYIVNFFENEIDWVCPETTFPLFSLSEENINLVDYSIFHQIDLSSYSIIINLEKDPDILKSLRGLDNVYGFIFDDVLKIRKRNNDFQSYDSFISSSSDFFEEKLEELLGTSSLQVKRVRSTKLVRRIGLNWQSGKKWPEKQIDMKIWKDLEATLSCDYEISWQKGFNNLSDYIQWISECDLIVTLDSLGLHISKLLDKSIVALFGPTDHREINLENYGEKVFYRNKKELSDLLNNTKIAIDKLNNKL